MPSHLTAETAPVKSRRWRPPLTEAQQIKALSLPITQRRRELGIDLRSGPVALRAVLAFLDIRPE